MRKSDKNVRNDLLTPTQETPGSAFVKPDYKDNEEVVKKNYAKNPQVAIIQEMEDKFATQ